jgi:Tol biopolymer transport system component
VVELPLDMLNAGIRKDGKALVHRVFVLEGNYLSDSYVLIDLLASLRSGKLKGVQMPPFLHETNNPKIKEKLNAREHVWSPNGEKVAFLGGNKEMKHEEIWLVQSGQTIAQQLTDLRSSIECPRFAPDNATIYFLKLETDSVSMKSGIWKVSEKKVCVQVADYKLFDNPLGWRPKK